MLEALLAEPHGDVERACAVVAKDDGRTFGVKLYEAGRDIAHGDRGGAGDAGNLDLPGFPDVNQEGSRGLVALGGVGIDGDLRRKSIRHGVRIPGARLEMSKAGSVAFLCGPKRSYT